MTHVAVVGGGVSGLAAAQRLRTRLGPAARITVLEGSARLGGALQTVQLGGLPADVGAEAFLVRRPEVLDLLAELGLGGAVAHPTGARPTVRAGGRTVDLPPRTLLGLPTAPGDVAGVLSPAGLAGLAGEASAPLPWEPGGDVAVGRLLRERGAGELVDRLVDPLLGGVYAGRADALGLRATLPGVAAALDAGAGSVLAATARVLPPPRGGPVFGTLPGGLAGLVDALAAAAGADVQLRCTVRGLARTAAGWRLELGSAARPEALDVDAVLLAVPVPALRRLLAGPVPAAAAALARVEVASSVLVSLALPAAAARGLPEASGVLVAAGERVDGEPLTAKAYTFSARKWAHAGDDRVALVRGSLGRAGETASLQRDDAELVAAVRADLAALTGVTAEPVDAVVTRWGGGLPQYAPGHADVVFVVERAVAAVPGLAVAGAALHGVGIPACVGTARAAAEGLAALGP